MLVFIVLFSRHNKRLAHKNTTKNLNSHYPLKREALILHFEGIEFVQYSMLSYGFLQYICVHLS